MATLKVQSPFDGSEIATITKHTAKQAEEMLKKAQSLYEDRSKWLAPHERIAILNKLAAAVEAEQDEFAMLIAKEGGKPLVDAKIEVARAIDGIHLAVKELLHLKGEEIPMGLTKASENRMAFTFREPVGIVVAVSAFNHPLNLTIHQVIPAIATGCPIIIKPASTTPLNCLRVVELLKEAGLPEGWCQACVCDRDVAEQLVTDSRIGFFSFIGSAAVGWSLHSKLAPGVHSALEHGGVAPVVVDNNVDIDKIIPALAKGGFYHSGQVCVSVQRIYVHEDIVEEFSKKFTAAAKKVKVGDATKEDTDAGPLIENKEVDRVESWVNEAVKAGAELLTGGKRISDSTYEATVLLNPADDASVSCEEVFGPVVCIYSVKGMDEAIKRANALPFSFQAAIFSENIRMSMDAVKRLKATAVMVNDHTAFRVDWMPFGGRAHSGYGMGGIGYSMRDLMPEKMMVINNN